MNRNGAEFVEIFLQEASDRLQYLREYANLLLDAYPSAAELERLYIAAHTLSGTSASYGFPLFSEIAGKLAHIFQYAMHASIAPEAAAPLLEFISEAVALLESDLIVISSTAVEAADDIDIFKQRYPFAFPQPRAPEPEQERHVVAVSPAPVPAQPLEEVPVAIRQDVEPEPIPSDSIRPESIPKDDEVPAEILEFFVPEAEEHLQIATQCLLALEESPSEEQVHRLLRAMHTVKGSAAQVGLHRISHVAHRAEDLIGRVRDGELQPTAQIIDICLESVDVLKKFLYRHWNSDADMQAAVQSLFGRIAAVSPIAVDEQPGLPAAPVESAPESLTAAQAETLRVLDPEEEALLAEYAQARTAFTEVPAAAVAVLTEPADKTDEEVPRKEFQALPQTRSVRVALERLDRMMNAVGELVINRTRMIGRLNELEHLADVLNLSKSRMQDKVAEFQEKHEFSRIHMAGLKSQEHFIPGNGGAYPSLPSSFGHSPSEFSELELDRYDDFNILSRSLTEISADISEVLSQLGGFVRRVDSDIDEFTKLAHRLQDEITQARMVPIGNLYTRLSRTVRDAAKAAGKRAELKLEGAETELDNNIIQQISDPLIHLVRNAVAHGIEREDERYEQGKSDVGNVIVRAYHRGNHIFVEVEDDGRGIDYEQVRKIAVDVGLVYPEAALELTQEELLDLLFQPGFSTAPRTTELAGRGVGLDVVRSNLVALNGEIEVHSEPGRGTRFTLKVPLTLVIAQALFVRCGSTMFAVPLTFIQEIRRVKVEQIEEVDGKMMTTVRDIPTEVLRVDVTLGLEPIEPVDGYYRMVVVSATGRQVGLIVEDVVRKDEIVIKNLGDYLRKVKMFPGATIAPDGSLILLLDVNRLVSIEAIERPASAITERVAIAPPPASAARIFRPGAEAVAQGTIPQEAIDVVRDEKIVLLVDDSISVRKFVGRMLEKAGYRVKLAADGLEALEVIAQTRCDLVVTDLEMPRTNGYELLSHLRNDSETRSVPVMVVTSRAGAKHRDRAMKEGASAFLTKPVQEDHFVAAVGRLIGVSPALPAAKAEALQ